MNVQKIKWNEKQKKEKSQRFSRGAMRLIRKVQYEIIDFKKFIMNDLWVAG